MMQILKKEYKKKNGEKRNLELYVLKETKNSLEGIDLTRLDDEAKNEFIDFIKSYEEKLGKFVAKAYRSFIKDNFID